jgi:arginine decarboxylase
MDKAPGGIIKSIACYIRHDPVRMHMPGHKGRIGCEPCGSEPKGPIDPVGPSVSGTGAVSHMAKALLDALDAVKPLDVTEIPGLDNLHYPGGAIKDMQNAMAEAFGAAATYCLINGATCGILASLIALRMTMGPGMVIVPRNAHRSIISGLILSGLDPLFVYPEYDRSFGGYLPLKVADIQAQLMEGVSKDCPDLARQGRVCGIVVVNPTYAGVCGDIGGICDYAHGCGIPVIADEAHGTLFSLSEKLPASAIETGASLVVHGVHKTTEAFTQTGLLHVTSKCLKRFPELGTSVEEALRLVQSSSPSYILLASLERAIHNLKQDATWVESMIKSAHLMKRELSNVRGIRVRTPENAKWDPAKILVDVSGLGVSGPEVQRLLWDKARVVPEMVGSDYVVLMVTGADTAGDVEKVVRAFRGISNRCVEQGYFTTTQSDESRPGRAGACAGLLGHEPPWAEAVIPLSQAFYSRSREYSLEQAVGKISCDTVLIYPPGSPVVVPGEKMTEEIVEYLRQAMNCGLEVVGRGYSGSEKELKVFCLDQ